MSDTSLQFVEIIHAAWHEDLYCGQCGRRTEHVGREDEREEIYTCTICQSEKWYTVG